MQKKSLLKYLHRNAFSISNNKFVFFNADISSVSQQTVSRAIAEVIDALSTPDMIQRFIRFPRTREELRRTSLEFHGLAGFPKVLFTNNKNLYNFVVFVSWFNKYFLVTSKVWETVINFQCLLLLSYALMTLSLITTGCRTGWRNSYPDTCPICTGGSVC